MKRGFTLIETVLLIGITTAALGALTSLFISFNSIHGYQKAFMATGSAGTAMNAFQAVVLPANQVVSSHSFSGTIHTSATTTLVLELPAINASGIVIAGAKDYIAFYSVSSTLYQLTQAHAQSTRVSGLKQLSTTLQTLSFTYDNADLTKVTSVIADIQTQAQFKQQIIQNHLREQMYLRNFQ